MTDLTATADELLAVVRERFPREYEIAFLTLANRKQAERLAELERAAQQPREHTSARHPRR